MLVSNRLYDNVTYNHHGCWYVRLAVPHCRIIHQRREPDSAVLALYVEVVFERDWQAVERSNNLASSIEVVVKGFGDFDGFVEERVAKAIRLMYIQYTLLPQGFRSLPHQLLRCCCALAERPRDTL
jgi:hypothetical protein